MQPANPNMCSASSLVERGFRCLSVLGRDGGRDLLPEMWDDLADHKFHPTAATAAKARFFLLFELLLLLRLLGLELLEVLAVKVPGA